MATKYFPSDFDALARPLAGDDLLLVAQPEAPTDSRKVALEAVRDFAIGDPVAPDVGSVLARLAVLEAASGVGGGDARLGPLPGDTTGSLYYFDGDLLDQISGRALTLPIGAIDYVADTVKARQARVSGQAVLRHSTPSQWLIDGSMTIEFVVSQNWTGIGTTFVVCGLGPSANQALFSATYSSTDRKLHWAYYDGTTPREVAEFVPPGKTHIALRRVVEGGSTTLSIWVQGRKQTEQTFAATPSSSASQTSFDVGVYGSPALPTLYRHLYVARDAWLDATIIERAQACGCHVP